MSPTRRQSEVLAFIRDFVRRHDYSVFVLYRLVVAAIVVVVIVTGARAATF